MVLIKRKKEKTKEELEAEQLVEQQQKAGIQDEFQAKGFELVSWVQTHRSKVLIGISALVLLGVVVSFVSVRGSSENGQASALYEEAQAVLDDTQQDPMKQQEKKDPKVLQDALGKYLKVIEQYPSTKVANLARLHVGALAVELGDAKTALTHYSDYVNKSSSKDPLYQVGMTGLAYANEETGDKKAALANYERLLALKNVVGKETVLFQSMRLASDVGEAEKAKGYAETLLKDFPNSAYQADARMLAPQASTDAQPVTQ